MKRVHVLAYAFDCLPGHVMIGGRGAGATFRTAISDALRVIFADRQLKWKRIGECKLRVVAIGDAAKR